VSAKTDGLDRRGWEHATCAPLFFTASTISEIHRRGCDDVRDVPRAPNGELAILQASSPVYWRGAFGDRAMNARRIAGIEVSDSRQFRPLIWIEVMSVRH